MQRPNRTNPPLPCPSRPRKLNRAAEESSRARGAGGCGVIYLLYFFYLSIASDRSTFTNISDDDLCIYSGGGGSHCLLDLFYSFFPQKNIEMKAKPRASNVTEQPS